MKIRSWVQIAFLIDKHGITEPCLLSVLLGCCSHSTRLSSGPLLWTKTAGQGLGYELWHQVRAKVNYSVDASNPRLWPQECHAWINWTHLATDTSV